MVECGGLENRYGGNVIGGSNPPLSVLFGYIPLLLISGIVTKLRRLFFAKRLLSLKVRVSHLIAQINQESENTVPQRLKECYKEEKAKAKLGSKQVSLEVKKCFSYLVKSIVELQPQTNQELAVALDATRIDQIWKGLKHCLLWHSNFHSVVNRMISF